MQENALPLYLASASPRRQELIQTLQLPVIVSPSDVDESFAEHDLPSTVAETLALRKAKAVYDRLKVETDRGIVIGADTIVVHGRQILGKPHDEHEAFQTLFQLQGDWHAVYTGFVCLPLFTGVPQVDHCKTDVKMRKLDSREINNYIQTGEPMDKAGSYGIQGLGSLLVEEISGCYFNVVGLPLSKLNSHLTRYGIEVI